MNRYPAPRGGRDRAPTPAEAAAQAMGAQVGDEHSGSAQVRVLRWLLDLRVHRRAAPRAGHVAQRSPQGSGPQEDAEARTPAAGAEARGQVGQHQEPAWGGDSLGPPRHRAPARKGRSKRKASPGHCGSDRSDQSEHERLNKNPTKGRPHRETELCASAANHPGREKPRQPPASLIFDSPSNLGSTKASQVCSPDQSHRLHPSSC